MSDNGLSITIENFEFTLIYKTTTYETGIYIDKTKQPITQEISKIVKIKSVNLVTGDEEVFWVYLSISELGVWRFLSYETLVPPIVYYKGREYIQSSCINMDLQKHIYLCYDRLTESREDIEEITSTQPEFESIISENIKLTQEYITKYKRILNDQKRQNILKQGIIKPGTPIGITSCGTTQGINEGSVVREIQETSTNLESNYKIVSSEEIFRYSFVFRDVINSENIVMKVILENIKNSNEKIILFYKKMIFTKLNISPYDGNIDLITSNGNEHFVVMLVIPYSAQCLNNGLYSAYINLGIYVCKPFDYTRYINRTEIETLGIFKNPPIQCTNDYSYVGYRYINIFPIKYIERPLPVIESGDMISKGGKRKKRKSKKKAKKMKYTKSKKKLSYKGRTR